MKKVLFVVLVVCLMAGVGLLMIVGVAQAGIIDDAMKYITERPVKAGISYDLDSKEVLGSVGAVLVENAFIKNLDIDLIASGESLDILNNDNKIVSLGGSYNLDLTPKTKLSLDCSLGVDGFENFNDGNRGEAKVLLSALVKYKF